MTNTVTMLEAPGTVSTPVLIDGFESTVDSNHIGHKLANGRTVPEFRTPSLRKGTLRLVYGTDETASRTAELMFIAGQTFKLDTTERPSLDNLTFWIPGRISRALDDETRDVWTVSVDFEELDT